jgi:hypothetical protein
MRIKWRANSAWWGKRLFAKRRARCAMQFAARGVRDHCGMRVRSGGRRRIDVDIDAVAIQGVELKTRTEGIETESSDRTREAEALKLKKKG